MFGMNIKRRRRRKKIRVQYKKCSFYTTKPLSESFFAEQKRENGAAGKIFFKVQPWAAELFFFFVPQYRQGLPKCANAMHFATTMVASTCSTARSKVPSTFAVAPYCIIIYSVVREVKGTRPKEAGGDFFLFIMAWYRTPRAECELFSATRGPARPPRLFPLRKALRKINFPRIKSLEKIIFPPCKILRKKKIKSKSGPGHPL